MARNPTAGAPQHEDADPAALDSGASSLANVAGSAAQVVEMMGYELAYNRDRVVQETRFFMAEAAGAMLEAGKRLVLLKEHEPHGVFTEIVEEQLGIPARTARQLMQAAVKYLSDPTLAGKRQTFAVLGKAKMFELMTLDNDDLVELSEGGSVAGLTLDDVDTMSVRELKAALRDARADVRAKDEVLASKSATIDKLQTRKARLTPPTPDEEVAEVRRETSDYAFQAEAIIRGSLREGIAHLSQQDIEGASQGEFVAGLLAQLERALAEIRSEFGVKSAPDGDATPEWDKDR